MKSPWSEISCDCRLRREYVGPLLENIKPAIQYRYVLGDLNGAPVSLQFLQTHMRHMWNLNPTLEQVFATLQ